MAMQAEGFTIPPPYSQEHWAYPGHPAAVYPYTSRPLHGGSIQHPESPFSAAAERFEHGHERSPIHSRPPRRERKEGHMKRPPRSAPSLFSLGGDCELSAENGANTAKNQLNLETIAGGGDTRTTLMIKNIPNKMSDKDLLDFINGVCPRRIDFLYLRMDFQNGTCQQCARNDIFKLSLLWLLQDVT